ncbi:hypothetical protein QTP86_022611, partial [Hemibagrus guttatus]
FRGRSGPKVQYIKLEAGRGLFCPKRRGFLRNQQVQDNFPSESGEQDLLFSTCMKADYLIPDDLRGQIEE